MSEQGKTAVPAQDDIQQFLGAVTGLAAKLQTAFAPGSTVLTSTNEAIPAIQGFLGLAGEVVGTFVPGATIAGFAVSKAIALASAIADAAPDAVAAVQAVKAAVDGGAAPTPEQWAALDAAADQAHAGLQAAGKAFLAQHAAQGG